MCQVKYIFSPPFTPLPSFHDPHHAKQKLLGRLKIGNPALEGIVAVSEKS